MTLSVRGSAKAKARDDSFIESAAETHVITSQYLSKLKGLYERGARILVFGEVDVLSHPRAVSLRSTAFSVIICKATPYSGRFRVVTNALR